MKASFKRIVPSFLVLMALYTTFGTIVDVTRSRPSDQIIGLAFFAAILSTAIIRVIWEIDRPTLKRDAIESQQEKQKRQHLEVLLRDFSEDELHLLQRRLQGVDEARNTLASDDAQMRKHNES